MKKSLTIAGIILMCVFIVYFLMSDKKQIAFEDSPLEGDIVSMQEIKLVGLEFPCTNNNLVETGFQKISNAFDALEDLQIKARTSEIFVVNYGFPKDYKKDISFTQFMCFVGVIPENANIADSELQTLTIKKGKYIFVNLPVGLIQDISILQEVFIRKYQEILKDKKVIRRRSYKFDFEVYSDKTFSERSVKIYIGIN